VSQFLKGVPIEWPHILEPQEGESFESWQKFVCTVCGGRILNGTHEWLEHLRSRQHRRRRKSQITHLHSAQSSSSSLSSSSNTATATTTQREETKEGRIEEEWSFIFQPP
jgi:hypothetical protein